MIRLCISSFDLRAPFYLSCICRPWTTSLFLLVKNKHKCNQVQKVCATLVKSLFHILLSCFPVADHKFGRLQEKYKFLSCGNESCFHCSWPTSMKQTWGNWTVQTGNYRYLCGTEAMDAAVRLQTKYPKCHSSWSDTSCPSRRGCDHTAPPCPTSRKNSTHASDSQRDQTERHFHSDPRQIQTAQHHNCAVAMNLLMFHFPCCRNKEIRDHIESSTVHFLLVAEQNPSFSLWPSSITGSWWVRTANQIVLLFMTAKSNVNFEEKVSTTVSTNFAEFLTFDRWIPKVWNAKISCKSNGKLGNIKFPLCDCFHSEWSLTILDNKISSDLVWSVFATASFIFSGDTTTKWDNVV